MAIYEYKCECGEVKELIIPGFQPPKLVDCVCGKQMQKVEISQSSFRLIGSNWPGKMARMK